MVKFDQTKILHKALELVVKNFKFRNEFRKKCHTSRFVGSYLKRLPLPLTKELFFLLLVLLSLI